MPKSAKAKSTTSTPAVDESAVETNGQAGHAEPLPVPYPHLIMRPYFSGTVKTVIGQCQGCQGKGGVDSVVCSECEGTGDALFEITGLGPITESIAEKILGWTTLAEFKEQCLQEDPSAKEESIAAKFADLGIILEDYEGQPIVCLNNLENRPFKRRDADRYRQDMLQRNWAGPTSMPGETINCEAIVVDRLGRLQNGQKRLIAYKLACRDWRKQPNWHKPQFWPDGPPVLDAVVWFGVSDNVRVVQTIDNVSTRTAADVLFTTNQFPEVTHKTERVKMTSMLDHAVHTLWSRTGITTIDQHSKQCTHSMLLEFLSRHEYLKDCVRFVWKRNLSNGVKEVVKDVNLGRCAAILYLMASSNTDVEKYRNELSDDNPRPSEKSIKWTNRTKAIEFWKCLVPVTAAEEKSDKCIAFQPVRDAIKNAVTFHGDGGDNEQVEVLARAWLAFAAGLPLVYELLRIKQPEMNEFGEVYPGQEGDYKRKSSGKMGLEQPHLFGGIDVGPRAVEVVKVDADGEEQTPADKSREEELKRLADEVKAKFNAAKSSTPTTMGLTETEVQKEKRERAERVEANLAKAAAKTAANSAPSAKKIERKGPVLRGGIG